MYRYFNGGCVRYDLGDTNVYVLEEHKSGVLMLVLR